MRPLDIKRALQSGQSTIGSWITLGHPAIAEVMAGAGFDWLAIDVEHSVVTLAEVAGLIRAIDAAGLTALVRLTSNDENQAKRVMDAGAHGVIVPNVNTPEAAARAVAAVKYPPVGRRGVGLARAQRYGWGFEDYIARNNDESLVIVQIEHVDAIAQLEGILSTPGIDASIIGPYDLSASLGVPGRFNAAEVEAALHTYETVSRSVRTPMGYHQVEPDKAVAQLRMQRGYQFLGFGVDFTFLGGACRQALEGLRL